jgi:hypothetical protein
MSELLGSSALAAEAPEKTATTVKPKDATGCAVEDRHAGLVRGESGRQMEQRVLGATHDERRIPRDDRPTTASGLGASARIGVLPIGGATARQAQRCQGDAAPHRYPG